MAKKKAAKRAKGTKADFKKQMGAGLRGVGAKAGSRGKIAKGKAAQGALP